ncbi:DUF4386 family protein [Nocardioides daphniae]|uniref:DUF4386 family protein n=1 Tax=Nocardioides daphniae TaxID=402297 RepID=A0A4P7UER2_9ACTN|nr:DUF4386 family protein [Nocardioides daphniae]
MTAPDLRTPAVVAGAALLVMAVLAPLGLLLALPAGHFGVAALVALTVAVLDVVAAVALLPVLATGGELWAWIAATLRVAYAAVFTVAGASLLAPVDEARFHAVWDAGLLVFGAHLLVAGAACVRSTLVPTWIGWLVVLAGAGYAFDAVVVAVGAESAFSLGAVTFVGEVVLLLWLLVRCGRQ